MAHLTNKTDAELVTIYRSGSLRSSAALHELKARGREDLIRNQPEPGTNTEVVP